MTDKSHSTPDQPPQTEAPIDVEDLRPHVFDGIQEYDKRLPNWWLATFYGAIIFAVGYWIVVHQIADVSDPGLALKQKMHEARQAAILNAPELSDAKLWAMSRDHAVIDLGKKAFDTTCASCHRPDLEGQIGPNLKDTNWIHGGEPLAVAKTIREGVLLKGMPAWGPILGEGKVAELCAYILSYHKEGEPIVIVPSPTPGTNAGASVPTPPTGAAN